MENTTNFGRVTKLSNRSEMSIFVLGNGFTSQINNFLCNERPSTTWESVIGIQVIKTVIDVFQISRPHMFNSIYTESSNTIANTFVHQINNSVTYPLGSKSQIWKTNQPAVSYLVWVIVVVNFAVWVEVVRSVWHCWEIQSIDLRTSCSLSRNGSHMIDYNINVDTNSNVVTTAHHACKFRFTSGTSVQMIRSRLIAFPPWSSRHNDIFRWRRNLNAGISSWGQEPFALVSNVVPSPFE
ncbi:AAEL008457-PA [Aedes aegypti]|uniref:AAEL008457-PA n=1 Tax=Aedes aegypti TaxID=7159 RepID=Q16YR1_AEDAE|nr:AAEL008457-PA [Aedes aegypti]